MVYIVSYTLCTYALRWEVSNVKSKIILWFHFKFAKRKNIEKLKKEKIIFHYVGVVAYSDGTPTWFAESDW